MSDERTRFLREPPVFMYKGFRVLVLEDRNGHYYVTINDSVLRASDPKPLRFKAYPFAADCAKRTIDRKLAREEVAKQERVRLELERRAAFLRKVLS